MGYEMVERNLAAFDGVIARLGVKFADDSPNKKDFDTTREFLKDRKTLEEAALMEKWNPRFKEFYHAQIVVKRLTDAVVTLKDQNRLKSRLKQVLGGSLTQDFVPDAAKDYFYELEMAALWKDRGFTVELAEPDVVVSGNGLSAPLGVACKYPSSWNQIHSHVSKGYKQITRHGYEGLVCIGLDQLVFNGMSNYMDFRQNDKHPLEIMETATGEAMMNLVGLRKRDYPSEKPIDGAMLTMSAVGIYGQPAHLTSVRYATLQCDQANPRYADFSVIYEKMKDGTTTTESRERRSGVMTPFEKHQEMERVSNALRDFTKPSLAAIYGMISKNEGELIGSGTFLRIKGMSYLLTAAHVAKKSREYPMRAHSTSFGGHPAPIFHPFRYLPPPLDLAVVPIDKATIENSEVKPLNVEMLDTSGAISVNEFLFVHGYPCHRSKPLPIEGGGVLAKSMHFHTTDGKTDWPFFNPQDHIAIEYPNFGWQEEGRPIPRPEAFCLSGSGVWRTNRANFSKEEWSPDKARMIGVNIVWTPGTESLVATRIEVVRSFLLDVVKQDVAYLRWEGRGKPLGDDWDDWFEGADKITELTPE